MTDTIKQLEARVQELIEEVKDLEAGSDEHKARVDELNKLGGILRDLKDVEYKEEDNYRNYGIKLEEMQTDKINKYLMTSISAGSLIMGGVFGYWTYRFDEKGTITSTLGRSILNKICIPKK